MSTLEANFGSQNDDPELDDLEQQLLQICEDGEAAEPKPSCSRTFDFLSEEQPLDPEKEKLKEKLAATEAIFGNDSDSSDDEEVKNFLERKYNEYGREINMSLKRKEEERKNRAVELEVKRSVEGNDRLRISHVRASAAVPAVVKNEVKLNLPGVPKLQLCAPVLGQVGTVVWKSTAQIIYREKHHNLILLLTLATDATIRHTVNS